MAIGFTNTVNTGFTYTQQAGNNPDTTDIPALTTPSAAGADTLLLGLWGAISAAGSAHSAQTVSLPNVTGEATEVTRRYVGGTFCVESHAFYAQLSSAPSNINWNASSGSPQRTALGAALIFTGYDTGDPIRASASAEGNTTTITFPDTASVNDGDWVLRIAMCGKEDWSHSFSSFGGTEIINSPRSGVGGSPLYVGYSVKSGAGAPGTATLTQSAGRDYVALTVVLAVAGGGGSSNGAAFHYYRQAQ